MAIAGNTTIPLTGATISERLVNTNLKTYTSLEQLGLTGPVTMEQVCAALPSGSMYVFGNNRSTDISDVPLQYSLITIAGSSWAAYCECHQYGVQQYWVGAYYTSASQKFTGWKKIAMETIVPPGTIVPSAAASVPAGYLSCEGQAVSRTTYADLFAAIGTAYGAGDGSTTFGLPNLGYKYPRGGTASGRGAIGGKGVINLTVAQLPAHTMPMREAIMWPEPSSAPAHSTGTGWGAGWATAAGPWVGGITATNSIGSGSNVDTTDPYQYVRYYIKY